MFPVFGDLDLEEIPRDVQAKQYREIEPLLPVLVRRSSLSPWHERVDIELAALEVFDESDGIHSFYRVESVDALVAVASSLSRGGQKPFSRAAYFFALPATVVDEFELPISDPIAEGRCVQINARHYHVSITAGKKVALFSRLQEGGWYNYRVGKRSMKRASEVLHDKRCREYADGPCECEGHARVTNLDITD